MSVTASDIYRLIGEIETDLRRANAKFTTLRAHIAATPIPKTRPEVTCPVCGITLAGTSILTSHLSAVHGDEEARRELDKRDGVLA